MRAGAQEALKLHQRDSKLGPSAGLTLIPPGMGLQDTWGRQSGDTTEPGSGEFLPPHLTPSLPQRGYTSPPPSLSSPIFSNLVDIDDVVSLSYGNFSGIRRESHALYHVALPAILGVKTKIMSINDREKKTRTCPKRPRRFILRKGADHCPCLWLEG